jgi:uncharacterized repeat protein (TIGR01451 family)
MSKVLRGARILILAGLAAAFAVTTAQAQTPEGTTISNIASVDWTDANSNDYTAVTAQVDITVGFLAGISVTPDGGAQSPASPQGATSMPFTITNIGNGTDQVQLSEVITDASSVFDSIGYNWNATDYQTLAALNADLITNDILAAGNIVVNVVYKIDTGKGGLTANYELTATSNRDGGESDPGDYNFTVGETLGVTVTPDGGQSLTHLPSNGTDYTANFTVTNTGDGPEDFDLTAWQQDVADITIVSVDGVLGTTTTISLAAGANQVIPVVYTVLDVAAGVQDTVTLEASSQTGPGTAVDEGYVDLTVIRPALTITKQAWDATRSAQIAGDVLPGETVWYRIEVTNSGTAAATSVQVDDVLPGEVTYQSLDDPDTSWTTLGESGGTVTGTLATLAVSASDLFWIEVTID